MGPGRRGMLFRVEVERRGDGSSGFFFSSLAGWMGWNWLEYLSVSCIVATTKSAFALIHVPLVVFHVHSAPMPSISSGPRVQE